MQAHIRAMPSVLEGLQEYRDAVSKVTSNARDCLRISNSTIFIPTPPDQ